MVKFSDADELYFITFRDITACLISSEEKTGRYIQEKSSLLLGIKLVLVSVFFFLVCHLDLVTSFS
jgi:hypothetical protein